MNPAVAFANWILERERWARGRLATHAGRTLRVVIGPASTFVAIAADGTLEVAQGEPSLTLRISPLRVPALLAQPERFADWVVADGDADLASTLGELARTLPWLIEQAFARALGPIAGTRVADVGRALLAIPAYAADRLGASVGSYVRDEARVVPNKADIAALATEVAALSDRADTLDSRIDALAGEEPAPKSSTGS